MKKLVILLIPAAMFLFSGCADQQLTNCQTENEKLKKQIAELEEQIGGFVQLNEVSDELMNSEIKRLTKENEDLKKQLENK